MNTILCLLSGGIIGTKVESGQLWISDDKADWFEEKDCVETICVYGKYVEYRLNNNIVVEPIHKFRYTHTFYKNK